MDMRTERALINRHQAQYGRLMGTAVRWAIYNPSLSTKDPLYDEAGGLAGRVFYPLLTIPVLWIDNIEGRVDSTAFRTDKSDDIRMGVSFDQARAAGLTNISDDDAHILDIFYWPVKRQWYRVDEWEVLGQHAADFVVLGITGVQIFPDEEYLAEAFPANTPPPVS